MISVSCFLFFCLLYFAKWATTVYNNMELWVGQKHPSQVVEVGRAQHRG
jgi:hypothetical protein